MTVKMLSPSSPQLSSKPGLQAQHTSHRVLQTSPFSLAPKTSDGVRNTEGDYFGMEKDSVPCVCIAPSTKVTRDLLQDVPKSHLLVVQRLSYSKERRTSLSSHIPQCLAALWGIQAQSLCPLRRSQLWNLLLFQCTQSDCGEAGN